MIFFCRCWNERATEKRMGFKTMAAYRHPPKMGIPAYTKSGHVNIRFNIDTVHALFFFVTCLTAKNKTLKRFPLGMVYSVYIQIYLEMVWKCFVLMQAANIPTNTEHFTNFSIPDSNQHQHQHQHHHHLDWSTQKHTPYSLCDKIGPGKKLFADAMPTTHQTIAQRNLETFYFILIFRLCELSLDCGFWSSGRSPSLFSLYLTPEQKKSVYF